MAKKKLSRADQFYKDSRVVDIEEARAQRHARRRQSKKDRGRGGDDGETRVNRTNIALKVILILVLVAALAMGALAVHKIASLRSEQKELKAQQKQLESELEAKKKELEQADTPEYIEKQAREILNMVYPDEIIYVAPDEEDDSKNEKN